MKHSKASKPLHNTRRVKKMPIFLALYVGRIYSSRHGGEASKTLNKEKQMADSNTIKFPNIQVDTSDTNGDIEQILSLVSASLLSNGVSSTDRFRFILDATNGSLQQCRAVIGQWVVLS